MFAVLFRGFPAMVCRTIRGVATVQLLVIAPLVLLGLIFVLRGSWGGPSRSSSRAPIVEAGFLSASSPTTSTTRTVVDLPPVEPTPGIPWGTDMQWRETEVYRVVCQHKARYPKVSKLLFGEGHEPWGELEFERHGAMAFDYIASNREKLPQLYDILYGDD